MGGEGECRGVEGGEAVGQGVSHERRINKEDVYFSLFIIYLLRHVTKQNFVS